MHASLNDDLSLSLSLSLSNSLLLSCSSEVTIYIMEQSTLGSMMRVLATSACMYLHSQQRKVPYSQYPLYVYIHVSFFVQFAFIGNY